MRDEIPWERARFADRCRRRIFSGITSAQAGRPCRGQKQQNKWNAGQPEIHPIMIADLTVFTTAGVPA
jgi:hypothetical protein